MATRALLGNASLGEPCLKENPHPTKLSDFLKSAGSQAMKHLIERNKKWDRYLLSVPFTWLVRLDARVRVVDCMCKEMQKVCNPCDI